MPNATRAGIARCAALHWQVDRITDVEIRDAFDAAITELVELIELRRQLPAA